MPDLGARHLAGHADQPILAQPGIARLAARGHTHTAPEAVVSSHVSDTILARLGSSDRACQRLAAPITLPDSDTAPGSPPGSGLRRLSATRIGAIVMTAGTRTGLVGCRVRAGLLREGNAGRATGQYPDRMATIKTTPIIAASAASALEVTTVTEVITRLAAWLRRLPTAAGAYRPAPGRTGGAIRRTNRADH